MSLTDDFDNLDGRVSKLETTGPAHAASADTAADAGHATNADNAAHASIADLANALGQAAITRYDVMMQDTMGNSDICKNTGLSIVDCTCPAGMFVISG